MNSFILRDLMNLIINYPKDKTALENKMASISAFLMQKYINDLSIEQNTKNLIKNNLLEELKKT